MNKHKKLGRLATLLSIVRWIGLIVMVGGSAYVLFVRIRLHEELGDLIGVSTVAIILALAAVLVLAFLIWLATEVVVQVLRHFMRMEMIALFGPSAFDKPQAYQAPVYSQPPPQAMPPADYVYPEQSPPGTAEGV